MQQNSQSRPNRAQGEQRPLPERAAPAAPAEERVTREPPPLVEHEAALDEIPRNRKAVYTVIEQGDIRSPRWVRIGIAFTNRDGSLNVILDALPVNATMHIRDFPPRGGEFDG